MGKRDPGNKPQSNDRIPYCYIDISNLKCILCNKKVSENNCKCIYCMELFCADHLKNHREKCVKICRFCHESDKELTTCYICQGMYCKKCFEKHKVRKDKHNEIHYDKCKKQLSNKLLQGDMIEHPLFIMENNWKIDFKYYLTNQIEKPVYQIFELVMKDPKTIIVDLVRKMNNIKSGNHSITAWLQLAGKNNTSQEKTITIKGDINEVKKIIEKVNNNQDNDEEDNLLGDQFDEIEDESITENMDEIMYNDIDI
jgi:hypothetical protein